MRRTLVTLAALVVGVFVIQTPATVSAWGMDVHRAITRRAIEGLPAPLHAYFVQKIDFISEHSADPDLWRVAGLTSAFGEEDPNHFLDMDGYGEPAPFSGIPREWSAVVAKYGADKANHNGRLPWRTEEMFNRLVSSFQDIAKGTPVYAGDNARYLSAVLAHYIEDGHVPFHAVVAYDGQATNQRGIHSRFEDALVLRNIQTFALPPVAITPIPNIRDFMFDTLFESNRLVPSVLAADKNATEGHAAYDDAYYAAFAAAGGKAIAEKRFGQAASAVASAIVSAWEKAGKPAMPAIPAKLSGTVNR